ncbi:MAG: DUF3109 family protein [Bacteroidales bacterium]|nr:DUF3109 family protein [Bacteroidales bacterium]
MVQIGDVLVSEDVVNEFFACDYAVCKGACCIVGDSGAPLEESEIDGLERDFPAFSPLMPEVGRKAAEDSGFFAIDRDGDMVTPLVPGSEECAFCCFEDGNCLCAIEKAGKVKPISCALYPIRVKKFKGGGMALNLHRWDICRCAFERGKRDGIRAYQFLKGPLTRRFGADFYEALDAAAQHINK